MKYFFKLQPFRKQHLFIYQEQMGHDHLTQRKGASERESFFLERIQQVIDLREAFEIALVEFDMHYKGNAIIIDNKTDKRVNAYDLPYEINRMHKELSRAEETLGTWDEVLALATDEELNDLEMRFIGHIESTKNINHIYYYTKIGLTILKEKNRRITEKQAENANESFDPYEGYFDNETFESPSKDIFTKNLKKASDEELDSLYNSIMKESTETDLAIKVDELLNLAKIVFNEMKRRNDEKESNDSGKND